ncbi:MAG TPA: TlpA disulfide reductase family protein, partial [Candidatus Acidoferrales bacterium]|nr:TlpA disulfide reductase family protein [Candidatus Acidoferrales bacterium]
MRKTLVTLFCAAALLAADGPRRAPGFCLIDSTGQWRDLADYRGKAVLLEFMQTTCSHCAAFAPKLKEIQQKYGTGLQILAVALPPDNPSTILQYVKVHGLSYPMLFDMGQVAGSYVRVPSLEFPTIYLIDANGMIEGHYEYGALTHGIFEANGLLPEL